MKKIKQRNKKLKLLKKENKIIEDWYDVKPDVKCSCDEGVIYLTPPSSPENVIRKPIPKNTFCIIQ